HGCQIINAGDQCPKSDVSHERVAKRNGADRVSQPDYVIASSNVSKVGCMQRAHWYGLLVAGESDSIEVLCHGCRLCGRIRLTVLAFIDDVQCRWHKDEVFGNEALAGGQQAGRGECLRNRGCAACQTRIAEERSAMDSCFVSCRQPDHLPLAQI